MKILIVEADSRTAAALQGILADKQHVVRDVANGSAGLMAALSEEYDLLICDVQLPDLHGTELVRALKAQSPTLPVMTMGDGDLAEWDQVCKDAGASCYLQKPVDLQVFLQEVTLVDKARLHLRALLVDPDPIHRTRITKTLNALGCEVQGVGSSAEAEQLGVRAGMLVLVDAGMASALETVRWTKHNGATCFAFKEQFDAATEEMLMRAGAALLILKPIDIDQLLTQAAFMAG